MFNSFRETSVAMANSPRTPWRCFMQPARRTHAFEPASRPENSAGEPETASIRTNTTWRKGRNRVATCLPATAQLARFHHEEWKPLRVLDSYGLDSKLVARLSGKLLPFPVRSGFRCGKRRLERHSSSAPSVPDRDSEFGDHW